MKIQAYLLKDSNLRDTAKRAFVSYAKSIFLMKNKKVFDVQKLDMQTYALSLGMTVAPRIRFLQRFNAKQMKNISNENKNGDESESYDSEENEDLKNLNPDNDFNIFSGKQDCETLLKNVKPVLPINLVDSKKKPTTKVAIVKKMLKQNKNLNKKIVFNDDEEVDVIEAEDKGVVAQEENEDEFVFDRFNKFRMEEDKNDKQVFQQKVKAKHKEEKKKLKKKVKNKESDDEDEFDSGSDGVPDLSWLPDPDKIYGKQNGEDKSDGSESDDKQIEGFNNEEKLSNCVQINETSQIKEEIQTEDKKDEFNEKTKKVRKKLKTKNL